MASAAAASVWTTRTTCVNPDPQDENHYSNGDWVYIRGNNFTDNTTVYWKITGKPGGASADPAQIVASGSTTTDGTGYFCLQAYLVGSDGDLDQGEYGIDVDYDTAFHGSKQDNYRVDAEVGSLTINKVVDSGNASADSFVFEITPDPYGVGQFSTSGGSKKFKNMPVGNYTIEEVGGPNGYHMVSNDCDVDVTNGDNVSCTVHNAQDTYNLTVNKWLWNGEGWSINNTTANSLGFKWTMDNINPWTNMGGTKSGVTAGNHLVSESSVNGYHAVGYFLSGSDMNCNTIPESQQWDHGTINIQGNTTVNFCNAVNPPTMGTLVVHKQVDTDGNGSFETTDPSLDAGYGWNLNMEDPWNAFGSSKQLAAGNYDVAEQMPAGYHMVGWTFGSPDGDICNSQHKIAGPENPINDVPVSAGETTYITFCNQVNEQTPPSLTITKTDNKVTALPGDVLTYEVSVANSGDLTAFNVQVDDTLPTFVSNVTDISDSGALAAGHIIWNNLTIAGHTTKTLTFKATVNAGLPAGTTVIHNVATLGCSPVIVSLAAVVCPFTGTATDDTSVTLNPTISIDKTGPATTNPNSQITYNLAWTVGGNASATNAVITDVIPTNTSFVSADNGGTFAAGTVTWNLGTKAPGSNGTVSVTVLVSPNATSQTILTNTGSFDTDQNLPVTDTVTTTVLVPQVLGISTPDLTIKKSVNTELTNPGKTLTYTVVVTNVGDTDATNVEVTDELPDGFTFVEGNGTTKTWNIGTLKAGASATIKYEVKVANTVAVGIYTNRAFVSADGIDPIGAQVDVAVRVPSVLGLATTGVTARDYATFLAGILMLALGFYGLRRLRLLEE